MESDLSVFLKALALFWGTLWGKVLVVLAGVWWVILKLSPDFLRFFRANMDSKEKKSQIDHLRAQARDYSHALIEEMRKRIEALETVVQAREDKIDSLVTHKIECNAALARLEEKYRSLSERVSGYGRAVDQLRSTTAEREKSG